MKRLIAAIVFAAAFAVPVLAQTPDDQPLCAGCPTPDQLLALTTAVPVPPVSVQIPPAETVPPPAPAISPPATQNTITTTAPVTSSTSISVGTLAGQFLAWIMVAFSGPIGGIVVWILVRVLKNLGITATDAMRARLQDMVVNALNISAPVIETRLAGHGQVEIKNAVVESAVAYVQAHGADALKALGLDPKSGDAVEAIKARIETAIADPAAPTTAVLDPPTPANAPIVPAKA